jgi:hypothetical protein
VEWEQTAARVVKPPPKVKTAEQIAAAAASQARIDALVADFDPDVTIEPRSESHCRTPDGDWYYDWSCKAGDTKMGGGD